MGLGWWRFLFASSCAWAQSGEIKPTPWVQNPVARHIACPVAANKPTVCTLYGAEDGNLPLEFRINSLPKEGVLYETSGVFRMFGSDPKHTPDPIGPHLLPFLITDPLHRIVYVPPYNQWPPEGAWSSFTYVVQLNLTSFYGAGLPSAATATTTIGPISEPGLVVFTNPEGSIAASSFDLEAGGDGWSISGNLADLDATDGGLKHHAFAWGALNRYVYGTDEVQFLDFGSAMDRSKWYFEAPESSFTGTSMAAAYGGTMRFTVRSLYGNFTELNAPLDWVTIECAACDSGSGARMVRFADDYLRWDGSERTVELRLSPVEGWMRDPLNSALDFTYASECEMAAILSNVSRVAILGDFTRSGEGVAIDNVAIFQPPPSKQPMYPVECQKGCPCRRHNPDIVRPTCC
mmetsp:Transcript_72518/g.208124  ORF Transcript_72518/g.208124 Transcript_72518/m.208124 type:complete len:405 (+) Transcript_72518:53-1267(+)